MARSHPRPATPLLPPQLIARQRQTSRFILLPMERQCQSESERRDRGHLGSETAVPAPDAMEFRQDGVKVVSPSPRESRLGSLQSSLVVRVQAAVPALHAISPRQDSALGAEIEQDSTRFP